MSFSGFSRFLETLGRISCVIDCAKFARSKTAWMSVRMTLCTFRVCPSFLPSVPVIWCWSTTFLARINGYWKQINKWHLQIDLDGDSMCSTGEWSDRWLMMQTCLAASSGISSSLSCWRNIGFTSWCAESGGHCSDDSIVSPFWTKQTIGS